MNFVWAFGYNVAAIPIAGGLIYPWTSFALPPWLAALAMVVSSISVLLSSLLLNVYKPPKKYSRQPLRTVVVDNVNK
jgi:Cu+-exporting ATPase